MTYTVVIDPRVSKTNIGIGTNDDGTYVTLSPCCYQHLIYLDGRNSGMICSSGCRRTYSHFDGLPRSRRNDGIWMQVFRWRDYLTDDQSLIELRDWIYRWTLLEVEIDLTY